MTYYTLLIGDINLHGLRKDYFDRLHLEMGYPTNIHVHIILKYYSTTSLTCIFQSFIIYDYKLYILFWVSFSLTYEVTTSCNQSISSASIATDMWPSNSVTNDTDTTGLASVPGIITLNINGLYHEYLHRYKVSSALKFMITTLCTNSENKSVTVLYDGRGMYRPVFRIFYFVTNIPWETTSNWLRESLPAWLFQFP